MSTIAPAPSLTLATLHDRPKNPAVRRLADMVAVLDDADHNDVRALVSKIDADVTLGHRSQEVIDEGMHRASAKAVEKALEAAADAVDALFERAEVTGLAAPTREDILNVIGDIVWRANSDAIHPLDQLRGTAYVALDGKAGLDEQAVSEVSGPGGY